MTEYTHAIALAMAAAAIALAIAAAMDFDGRSELRLKRLGTNESQWCTYIPQRLKLLIEFNTQSFTTGDWQKEKHGKSINAH
jgi:hypothetical protein